MENPLHSAPVELLDSCLVVEDDSIIRLDLEETLKAFGLKQVHGASSVEAAARIIASSEIRFALLDYNVGPANTVKVAETLAARGIPAVFLTAYGAAVDLPPGLSHLQVLSKPFSSDSLAKALLAELAKVRRPSDKAISASETNG
ncbi:response regulator [Aestuariivirga sp.]|uniref:response regulator n=1 Tax=Aestuariivirga sp. TaxID=2650926 RepID=UPI003BA96FB7